MKKTALLLIAAALGNTLGSSQTPPASRSPRPAPPSYVSQKFGLAIKVPSGLSYCPLSKKWLGAEQGTALFLEPPSSCLDSSDAVSSATRLISGFVPSVTIYYRANTGRYDNFDGNIPPLRSSEELAGQFCPKPLQSELRLLDQPSFTCRMDLSRDRVRIILAALYNSERKILVVTLLTDRERLTKDQQIFQNIVSAITACPVGSRQTGEEFLACPPGSVW